MKFYEFTYAEKTKNHTKIRDNKIIINGKAERLSKVSQLLHEGNREFNNNKSA